jgi:hypothetical protein
MLKYTVMETVEFKKLITTLGTEIIADQNPVGMCSRWSKALAHGLRQEGMAALAFDALNYPVYTKTGKSYSNHVICLAWKESQETRDPIFAGVDLSANQLSTHNQPVYMFASSFEELAHKLDTALPGIGEIILEMDLTDLQIQDLKYTIQDNDEGFHDIRRTDLLVYPVFGLSGYQDIEPYSADPFGITADPPNILVMPSLVNPGW